MVLARRLARKGKKRAHRDALYTHPDRTHLFLEFSPGPVELGDECPVTPDILEHEGQSLKI
jgi:hypothetical protein